MFSTTMPARNVKYLQAHTFLFFSSIAPISCCNRVLVFSGVFTKSVSAVFCRNSRPLPLAVLHCYYPRLFCFGLSHFEQYVCLIVGLDLCFCLVREGVCLWWMNPKLAYREVLEASIRCSEAVNVLPWLIISGYFPSSSFLPSKCRRFLARRRLDIG